jgi:hypothetical protein
MNHKVFMEMNYNITIQMSGCDFQFQNSVMKFSFSHKRPIKSKDFTKLSCRDMNLFWVILIAVGKLVHFKEKQFLH